jgi:steroid delta-isomerase
MGLSEDFVSILGNQAAVKWTGQGIGKNGRAVTFEGIDLFEFNTDSKIQTVHGYWDPAAMMQKLQG